MTKFNWFEVDGVEYQENEFVSKEIANDVVSSCNKMMNKDFWMTIESEQIVAYNTHGEDDSSKKYEIYVGIREIED